MWVQFLFALNLNHMFYSIYDRAASKPIMGTEILAANYTATWRPTMTKFVYKFIREMLRT